MTLKDRLEEARNSVQEAKDNQTKKKAERDALQKQYDEIVENLKSEFGLDPEELDTHTENLKEQVETLLNELEGILGNENAA